MLTSKPIPFLYLILLASIASFGAILPTPGLPAIANFFHITQNNAAETITFYLTGYSLGQLLYGPLANSHGRINALRIGLSIALIGSVGAILATIFHQYAFFVAARFLLALGTAAGIMISMLLIKDSYDDGAARKAFAKVILAFAIVPFIATALGGALTHYLGWQSTNIVMVIYVLFVLFNLSKFSETLLAANRQPIRIKTLFHSYRRILKEKQYIKLVLLFTLGGATSYIFNAYAPLIMINQLHLSSMAYGWLSVIPALGIFLGGSFSSHAAHKFGASKIIRYGLTAMIIGGILFVISCMTHQVNMILFYGASVILFAGSSSLIPNASMQALSYIHDKANGTALMNATSLFMCSLLVMITGKLFTQSFVLFPVIILLLGIVGTVINLVKNSD